MHVLPLPLLPALLTSKCRQIRPLSLLCTAIAALPGPSPSSRCWETNHPAFVEASRPTIFFHASVLRHLSQGIRFWWTRFWVLGQKAQLGALRLGSSPLGSTYSPCPPTPPPSITDKGCRPLLWAEALGVDEQGFYSLLQKLCSKSHCSTKR